MGSGPGLEIVTFATTVPKGRSVLSLQNRADANWVAAISANSARGIAIPPNANPLQREAGGSAD